MTSDSSLTSRLGDVGSDSSIASTLVLAGAVLFVIPEPVTSVLGAFVLLCGVVAWMAGHLL